MYLVRKTSGRMTKCRIFLETILISTVILSSTKEATCTKELPRTICKTITGFEVCWRKGILLNVTQGYQKEPETNLEIDDLGLRGIRPDAFNNNLTIENLDLYSGNNISILRRGSFRGLENLRSLDLKNNAVNLSSHLFAEMGQLTSLSLMFNDIKDIPRHSFAGLSSLVYLYLNSNQLTYLQSGAFSGLGSEFFSLWIYDNRISRIEPGAFDGLTKLGHIAMENNTLTRILPGTFRGLTKLWILELQDNLLTRISVTDFQGLIWMERMDLRRNRISTIEPGAFSTLVKLADLNLRGNKLSHIGARVFEGLKSLTTLDLSENHIRIVDSGAFNDLIAIDSIYFVNNTVAELDRNDVGLSDNGTIYYVYDCVIRACEGVYW